VNDPVLPHDEADRIWNLERCERCRAMEEKLRAALLANESWAAGHAALVEENSRLTRALLRHAQVWSKA